MNKNFSNLVFSCLHITEEKFNKIIQNLPDVIRNNDNLDFSEFGYDDYYSNDIEQGIPYYLLNVYITGDSDAFVDDFNSDRKTVYIVDVSSKKELAKIKSLLGDWTIVNEKELIEEIEENDQTRCFNTSL